MFTGIIQTLGKIQTIDPHDQDLSLRIDASKEFLDDVELGDSIACNGVCLTAVQLTDTSFYADVSGESINKTTIGLWVLGQSLNLEKALTPQQRLGGHIVSGHVDAVGEVTNTESDGRSEKFVFSVPVNLAKYIAEKGSVTIDGTSLTINEVDGNEFSVNIVPHTLTHTVFGEYKVGTKVNIEVDVIARYLERLMLGEQAAQKT